MWWLDGRDRVHTAAVPAPTPLRSLGFATDLALLRLGGSQIEDHDTHLVVRSPTNPTYWWGNFVLVRDLDLPATQGVSIFHDQFPQAEHLTVGLDTTEAVDVSAYQQLGLEPDSSVVLTAPSLPASDASVPATVRRLDGDDDWRQSVALAHACRDDSQDDDEHLTYLVARKGTQRSMCATGSAAWFGAFVDGRLASQLGVVAAGPNLDGEQSARYQHVETDPQMRRLGLAGALVRAAATYAVEVFGVAHLVIVADPGYHAIDLYRRVGFTDLQTQVQLQRPPRAD
jgi:ribosomal protein S18 acetylase RimI-like enzyme